MPSVFVIMPFGKKTVDPAKPLETTDFDEVYQKFIVPACTVLGWECSRIDEISFTGPISRQIIKRLASSDVVIADLTSANPNVYFELGIRQSLTERPTILIARFGTLLPFDIHDQRVVFYDYPSAPFTAAQITELSHSVKNANAVGARSPILSHLRDLGTIPSPLDKSGFEADLRQKISRASTQEQLVAIWHWASEQSPLPAYLLIDLADRISTHGNWSLAATIGFRAISEKVDDFELHRRHGWYLRNAGPPSYAAAEEQFRYALKLNPSDPETLGMLGGLLKRAGRYKDAAECYNKARRLAPGSLYIRVAHAGMTLIAEVADKQDTAAALILYRELFDGVLASGNAKTDPWCLAVLGECAFVLGQPADALNFFLEAARLSGDPTVLNSPADQLDLLGDQGFRCLEAKEIASNLRRLSVSVTTELAQPGESSARSIKTTPTGPLATIIHLSDIHFGNRLGEDGAKHSMHRFFDGDYSQTLAKHLRAELADPKGRFRLVGKPVTIVASGDFVYSATSEEFKEAAKLFADLRDALQLDPRQFVFCPGNHDINWAKSQISKAERFDPYLIFLREFYGPLLFRELYPLVTWDFSVMTPRPEPSDLVSVRLDKEQGLLFVSFNSCVYETEQHHYGFISQAQQRKVATLLDQLDISDNVIRIAVVHHHVHPYPDFANPVGSAEHWMDMSTIRDGGIFERFLERRRFDVVLHGHKHRPQLRETVVRDRHSQDHIKSLIVCGAGSCGVSQSELEHSTGNQFQVLEFVSRNRSPTVEFVRIEWRELALHPDAEWATTRIWNVLGG
ncbi:metallophosphoesterase [Bradyrhizobium sp. 38]|uniref:metallophosphoesterase n=1 Tax=unclassified Bradyrhizobium TaxID=2631580 RepID=UPI001FFA45D9|nr:MULTISPECIES: metallophosphoesterase [unclassified Bradyrhizobium]MCK1338624.1 metallophosphoesterase [Bradyrhizobium sp. 38]MCK1776030.1 metallophosphoesterase [Bradyrhizobium sp. 132]